MVKKKRKKERKKRKETHTGKARLTGYQMEARTLPGFGLNAFACYILAKSCLHFVHVLKLYERPKFKDDGLINLAEEILRQPRIQPYTADCF
jgi:hypothetical protein